MYMWKYAIMESNAYIYICGSLTKPEASYSAAGRICIIF